MVYYTYIVNYAVSAWLNFAKWISGLTERIIVLTEQLLTTYQVGSDAKRADHLTAGLSKTG